MSDLKKHSITLPARVIKHDTKAVTKDGIDVFKVTLQADCVVGGETVHTAATLAFRCSEEEIANWPLNDDFEITITRPKKPSA